MQALEKRVFRMRGAAFKIQNNLFIYILIAFMYNHKL